MSKNLSLRTKLSGLLALIAVPMLIATAGCNPECVDRFDCFQAKGDGYICASNKCVEDTNPVVTDAGM